jgi:hypothetical protein
MYYTVIIIVLAVGLVLVSLAAVGMVLWIRHREHKRDTILQRTEALAQLDESLDDALKELNKVGNLIKKEIAEKYSAMLFLYNLLEEKEKSQIQLPADIAADLNRLVPGTGISAATKTDTLTAKNAYMKIGAGTLPTVIPLATTHSTDVPLATTHPTDVPLATTHPTDVPLATTHPTDTPPKPKRGATKKPEAAPPRKRTPNPKHQKITELHAQGMEITDIAKTLAMGQGEVALVLDMAGKRQA